MKYGLVALVVLAGAGIPMQVAMNGRLRDGVQSPALTVLISFLVGALAAGLLVASGLLGRGRLPEAGAVPVWAWFGGVFSVAAVSISLIALPKAGAAAVVAGTVFGQLTAALVIDHFGGLGVEKSPVNAWKIVGAVLLATGALLMQKK